MITETGRVVKIEGLRVFIRPDMGPACFGCMKQECQNAGIHITADNTLNIPLSPGQMVETWIPAGMVVKAALSVFLPPALAFTAGYLLSGLFFPGWGEGARVFSGLILLLAAAFAVCLLGRRIPKTRPRIRRTL